MKIGKIVWDGDDSGVCHVFLLRQEDEPDKFSMAKNGYPRTHAMTLSLENPEPEKDPNANISVEDIVLIKKAIAEHYTDEVRAKMKAFLERPKSI